MAVRNRNHLLELIAKIEKRSRAAADWRPEGEGDRVGLFIPLPASADVLFPEKDSDTSPAHITYLVVGEIPEDKRDKALSVMRKAFEKVPQSVLIQASSLDHFTNPKGQSIAHLVPTFSDDLETPRKEIIEGLEDLGIEVKDHGKDRWLPHITLGYLDDEDDRWEDEVPDLEWNCSEIEVWGLPERMSIPFGSKSQPKRAKQSMIEKLVEDMEKRSRTKESIIGAATGIPVGRSVGYYAPVRRGEEVSVGDTMMAGAGAGALASIPVSMVARRALGGLSEDIAAALPESAGTKVRQVSKTIAKLPKRVTMGIPAAMAALIGAQQAGSSARLRREDEWARSAREAGNLSGVINAGRSRGMTIPNESMKTSSVYRFGSKNIAATVSLQILPEEDI